LRYLLPQQTQELLPAASYVLPEIGTTTMKLKLDTKTVAGLALAPGRGEAFAWDTELAGFGLRLQGQRRTWVAQYRAKGRTRRITLGATDRLTPAQAREGARRLLARVALGEDPQGAKAAQRTQSERTFRKVVDVYLAARRPALAPVSHKIARLYLTGSYFRPLHAMGLAEISHPDIAARLSAITRGHSANTANAARRAVSAFFRWTMEEGWAAANPVVGTRRPERAKARERVLAPAELVAIWTACDDGSDYSRIVRLLILLGSRRSEIGGMRWDELDLEGKTWTLPGRRAKNGRALTLGLPSAAWQLLPARVAGREHLFGTRAGSGFSAWDRNRAELDRRLNGAVKPWQLRDLRRTTATGMADIGIEPHVIEAILNHVSGTKRGVAGVYNRSPYARAVQAALLRWSGHIHDLAEGRGESNVVRL
jgi:integrase